MDGRVYRYIEENLYLHLFMVDKERLIGYTFKNLKFKLTIKKVRRLTKWEQ
jgi:hypothetical protein